MTTPQNIGPWRKSSYSGANGDCVEVAFSAEATLLRDSKDPEGPVLLFNPSEWTAFKHGVQAGEFDS